MDLRLDSRVESAVGDKRLFFPSYGMAGLSKVMDLPLLKATVPRMVSAEISDIEELPASGRDIRTAMEEWADTTASLQQRVEQLGDIGAEQTTKEQKIAAIRSFALNKLDADQSTVAVTAADIRGCVGVSRRYDYDLMDELVASSMAVRMRNGCGSKPKAVLVDCEGVHSGSSDVNRHTTPETSGGGV